MSKWSKPYPYYILILFFITFAFGKNKQTKATVSSKILLERDDHLLKAGLLYWVEALKKTHKATKSSRELS